MKAVLACLASAALLTAPMGVPALAQSVGVVQSDILVVDPERLFESTKLGQAMAAEVQAEREALIALNRNLEAELEAEEKALTALRDETSPEEFRDLADAFDTRVQEIRRESERRVRDLERSRERAPIEFMRQVEPVLVELMREAGAVVVLDRRSVLLRDDVVDITVIAAQRIDILLAPSPPTKNDAPQSQDENTPSDDPSDAPPNQDDAN